MQINNNFQKNANIAMVAQLLWRSPGISRVEIARQLDLYRSTVSNIINTLRDNGVVYEDCEGSAMPQGGRKPICLGLNERFGCVIGIEIQPSRYEAVILDLMGTTLHFQNGVLPAMDFDDISGYVVDLLEPVLTANAIPLLGVCMGMPGIIDSAKGTVILSDPFNLKDHALSSSVLRKYGVPVFIENDANCLAWLELANKRGDALKHFLCLNAEYHERGKAGAVNPGMGVGISVAIDGSVYSGSRHAAGEFVSNSWRQGHAGQTGLPLEVMERLDLDPEAFAKWVVDLFSSLVPVIAIFDPEGLFVHGELARRAADVRTIVADRVPQFGAYLERSGCEISYGDGSVYSIATGAAMMYLLQLFSAPVTAVENSIPVEWDSVFRLIESQKVAIMQ
jgi:predicted NBD/HSP70 family sugar kinase